MTRNRVRLQCSASCLAVALVLTALATLKPERLFGEPAPERFWIAGRYDGNRIIVYFDAVKFGPAAPSGARRIVDPVADGFFLPEELPGSYIARFQSAPNSEHFSIGEEYDVLTGGLAIPVRITSLIGTQGDEGVGNDSYIGALATVIGPCGLFATKNYYVLRPHREPVCGSKPRPGQPFHSPTEFASLVDEPVQFDVQTRIVSLMSQQMMSTASEQQRRAIEGRSPSFTVQPFRVADGSLRYYARARWKSGAQSSPSDFSLGAWLSPMPILEILAMETNQQVDLPAILNVVDLGSGRTGMIVAQGGEDSTSLDLVEYRDGLNVAQMPSLQSITAGE